MCCGNNGFDFGSGMWIVLLLIVLCCCNGGINLCGGGCGRNC